MFKSYQCLMKSIYNERVRSSCAAFCTICSSMAGPSTASPKPLLASLAHRFSS